MIDNAAQLTNFVKEKIEDKKGEDIVVLNVKDHTSVTDFMVIASGQSTQQNRAMGQHIFEEVKKQGVQVLGVEGENTNEWVLLDLGNVIVHLMLPEMRAYYELEKLWDMRPSLHAA